MPVFKVYILDDDPRAVRKLSRLVYDNPNLLLVGSQTDPEAGLLEIARFKPDILLLDLEMTPLSGWEVILRLDKGVKVILCTADARAGSQSYEVSAADYLVKPFSGARFNEAILRASGALEKRPTPAILGHETLYFTAGGASNPVEINPLDIEMIEACDHRCRIFHTYDAILVDQSFKEVERMLPASLFMRIHKSFMISLKRYYRHQNGKVYLKNVEHEACKVVPIGDKYGPKFYQYLLDKQHKTTE
ncbi:DNA-binding response regulator [Parapedobacter pyrenivorans]|uniref:DNA-binding response regulator n=1 Tax=Parapedobacter pyrenivorans TaxID=1305674 RepID=A0A917HYY4_9SPHI|nr:LytTR family DNA-binding domain-containing protein [Parapedobacter pyrenivorans]GGG96565.1 DNA-binding response regulator [Parapedobacter pyrenivorans]